MSVKFYLVVLMAVITMVGKLHAAVPTCTVSCQSSSLNAAVNLIRASGQNATIGIGSDQLHINGSSCMSRKDLEDLKTAWTSSQKNCTRPVVSGSSACPALERNVSIIREDLKDVKNLLGSNQPQPSCATRRDLEDMKAVCRSCVPNQQQCPPAVISNSSLKQPPATLLLCKY